MFEKFTQKAIDIVTNAQIQAGNFGADKVYSEHLLLGLVVSAKGVQARLIGVQNVDLNLLIDKISRKINLKKEPRNGEFIPFSESSKKILKRTLEIAKFYNNSLVIPAHLALAIYDSKLSGAFEVLKEFDFDEEKTISNLKGILNKKAKKVEFRHPEEEPSVRNNYFKKVDTIFTENSLSNLLGKAKAKLLTCGYEILGTEQIVQSLLDEESDLTKILAKYGITKKGYEEKLQLFHSRAEEYGERQIIFTPNAFRVMLNTFEVAKELGSVLINPEHVIMGVLKAKTGIAYKILRELTGYKTDLIECLTKELNTTGGKTMPETTAILGLAKAECRNLDKHTIGTEMILLGILAYNNGVASAVLEKLGITLKDARVQAKKLVGDNVEESGDNQMNYTLRAKKLLEAAYEIAKRHGKQKIMSEHLLYAFTKIKNCLGMEILENLGTDTLEIKQGILVELKNIQI